MLNNNKLLEFIGLVTIVTVTYAIVKAIEKRTETRIISEKALNTIRNKDKSTELRELVNAYKSNTLSEKKNSNIL